MQDIDAKRSVHAGQLWTMPRRRRTRLPHEIPRDHALVPREALVSQLLAEPRVVALIQAPAVYGKTTLMAMSHAKVLEREQIGVWLGIDVLHRNPRRLLSAVVLALGESGLSCDLDEHDLGDHVEAAGAELADMLAAIPNEVFLFVDDVHRIHQTSGMQLLVALSQRAAKNTHLVLASRGMASLPCAKLRTFGQVTEIGVRELRFNEDETFALFEQWPNLTLDQRREIHQRSEGWVGALMLMRRSLSSDPERANRVVSSFTGMRLELSEFFEQEVFGGIADDAELKRFLLETSILDKVCSELADEIRDRRDSRILLQSAMERGSFVFSVDREQHWYRLHTLMSQYLRTQLKDADPSLWKHLNRRASDWFRKQPHFVNAFEHALAAGDYEHAAAIFDSEVLDRWCSNTFGSPKVEVLTLCGRIPTEVKHRYPRIMLLEAWRRDMFWEFEGARDLLARTRESLQAMQVEEEPQTEDHAVKGLLLHGDMMLSCVADDMGQVEVQCEVLLRDYPDSNPYIKSSVYTSLLAARREQYKLEGIERLCALGREYSSRMGQGPSSVFSEACYGPAFFMAGRVDTALRSLTEALSLACELGGGDGSLGSIVALPLAEMLYERNETERAQELLDRYLTHGATYGFVDQLIAGWITAARLHQLAGDSGKALQKLDEADEFARRRHFERLRLVAAGERIRILLHLGRLDEALRVGKENGIVGEAKQFLPGKGTTTRDEARALAWTRLAVAQNQFAEATGVARHWRSFLEQAGALRNLLRWDVLMTHILVLTGDQRAAQRTLRRTLSAAVPGRFIRTFLDEGPWMDTLLRKQSETGVSGDSACDAFSAELLDVWNLPRPKKAATGMPAVEEGEGVYGSLNTREVEVLQLVGAGLLNREIGDRLGMTEGSVKWYLQRVYDKLGVRRRSQAMDRALTMGIIKG